jgi:hypothetical protein
MAFREKNPVRIWRRTQHPVVSHATLAFEMTKRGYRITPITLTRWENGGYAVPDPAMKLLIEITGIRDLPDRWAKWQKARKQE